MTDEDYDYEERDMLCPTDGQVYQDGWIPFECANCKFPLDDHLLAPNPRCPACHGEGDPAACMLCHKDYPLITSQKDLDRFHEIMAGPRPKPFGKPLPIEE